MTRSHYSPSLGRFLSRDPIAEQGGLNLYAFVRNNPILLTDSKGEAAPAVAAGCYATYPFDETGNKFCKKEASTAYALCLADC